MYIFCAREDSQQDLFSYSIEQATAKLQVLGLLAPYLFNHTLLRVYYRQCICRRHDSQYFHLCVGMYVRLYTYKYTQTYVYKPGNVSRMYISRSRVFFDISITY